MIKFWCSFNLSFRFSSKNRTSYRAGWADTQITVNPRKDTLVKVRHSKSFPIPHTSGIPIRTHKKYTIGNDDWYSRTYIFLKETRFYNDRPKTRYDYEIKKEVIEWEPSSSPELEPTDHCQMKEVSYYLPFISITTIYKTKYGVQKDREIDEYFEREFCNKRQ